MKHLVIFLLLSTYAITQARQVHPQTPPRPLNYLTFKEATRNVFLKFDKQKHYYIFDKNSTPNDLSNSDVKKIEKMIYLKVAQYNKTEYGTIYPIKYPAKYFKQFIAITNKNGEKEVWVNCCCQVMPYWKKEVEITSDGGSCYFQIKINLTTNKVISFGANGVA